MCGRARCADEFSTCLCAGAHRGRPSPRLRVPGCGSPRRRCVDRSWARVGGGLVHRRGAAVGLVRRGSGGRSRLYDLHPYGQPCRTLASLPERERSRRPQPAPCSRAGGRSPRVAAISSDAGAQRPCGRGHVLVAARRNGGSDGGSFGRHLRCLGATARLSEDGSQLLPLRSKQVLRATRDAVVVNLVLFLPLFLLSGGDGGGLAWEAHLGGFLFGLLAIPRLARPVHAAC